MKIRKGREKKDTEHGGSYVIPACREAEAGDFCEFNVSLTCTEVDHDF